MVVGPWGDILAVADHDEPAMVRASLDLDQVEAARRAIPALSHERAFTGP
jgi:predicted amidohydrolase